MLLVSCGKVSVSTHNREVEYTHMAFCRAIISTLGAFHTKIFFSVSFHSTGFNI